MTGPALRNVEARLSENEGLDRAWLYAWIRNAVQNTTSSGGISNEIILGALAILFALLAVGLMLVNKTLRRFAGAQGIDVEEGLEERTPLWKAFLQNQFLMIVVAIFFLLSSAYFVYGYLSQIGVDQGYQPVQPIHYSHKIHAGDNGIDCKYCHSSARVSKHSGIPSLNVCMNCHKSIYEVSPETATEEYSKEFYDGEIQKLYEAVGWDDAEQKYTGKTKPVKWVRIHRCIDCHRETNIDVKDNAYYTKIHEELSKKYGVENLTAAQMGGLECGKCQRLPLQHVAIS